MIYRNEEDLNVIWALASDPHWMPPVRIENPQIILDLGCWIGYTTRRYAEIWPEARIIACDADEDNASIAMENTKEFPNVMVFNTPVGLQGEARLSDSSKNRRTLKGGDGHMVNVLSVDNFLKMAGVYEDIDFCKMDVEGSELDCLKGRWTKRVKNILVDAHMDGVPERLMKLGFAIGIRPLSHDSEEQYWGWRR